ncbi:MAG: ABC transporter permease subunit [Acidimicrobiia bacterium]|nr:ABC transporter permease subunit [Acidimicrobiia bacterium]
MSSDQADTTETMEETEPNTTQGDAEAVDKEDSAPETSKSKAPRRRAGWRVVAAKELSDHLLSGRFVVLMAVLGIATAASVFAASGGIREVAPNAEGITALFLKLFTVTAEPVPFPLIVFMGFLAPLLGIMFGFDAVNGERSQGTLPRLLAQPLHRDEVILGKFVAGLAVITIMLTCLILFVSGIGIFRLGVVPTPSEISRLLIWLLFAIIYVAFWQALATLASVTARRAATSAFIPVGVWLVLTLFGSFIFGAIATLFSSGGGSPAEQLASARTEQIVSQISPITLFQTGSTVLLDPEVRSTGLLTLEQVDRAIVTELDVTQSLLVVWPQMVTLLAMTALLFALAYVFFVRQEVRA